MATEAPSNDTRVLIAHLPSKIKGKGASVSNVEGQILHLRHPKSGNPTCYILMDGCLQEIHWFKQRYGSWFLGEYVCEDGSLYVATPVDPIFIVLPLLDQARMKKDNESGKFRSLDELMFLDGYPGYHHLLPLMHNSIAVICEVKEIGSLKFYRLDDQKVLSWLCCKVKNTTNALPMLNKRYNGCTERETMLDAVGLLAEYLMEDPWLRCLCNHLGIGYNTAMYGNGEHNFHCFESLDNHKTRSISIFSLSYQFGCGVDLEATKKPQIKDSESVDLTSERIMVSDFHGVNNTSKGTASQKNTSKGRASQKRNDEKGLQKITSMFKRS